jgi:hypothetical protein
MYCLNPVKLIALIAEAPMSGKKKIPGAVAKAKGFLPEVKRNGSGTSVENPR